MKEVLCLFRLSVMRLGIRFTIISVAKRDLDTIINKQLLRSLMRLQCTSAALTTANK
jgi:hypothetical protein